MLTAIAIIAALFAGWACGEHTGYKRCVRDYKEASDKVLSK
jgi:hypothetical protein